ncbi:MAG: glycosyltransferase family 2 protein [Candidatus Woesearchaeota archaeon]|nr:glycosyltransferase family 2 protein [Candidatus Woesearchaeota archaeon]
MTPTDTISLLITGVFVLIIISYYVLLFLPTRNRKAVQRKCVSVLIPARNEAAYIADCIASVQQATFAGKKQIIVVNDASTDATKKILEQQKGILVLTNTTHKGKAYSLNRALKKATGDVIAIVDGDSTIQPDALQNIAATLTGDVVGAGGVVRCKNQRFINPWVHIELIYNSLLRSLFAKVNANIVTPGPLSMYCAKELREIGGFSTDGFSEDINVAVHLIRKGHHVGFCETAIADTNMPTDVKGILRQRTRMARGMMHVFKKHLQVNTTIIDLYTLPLFVFTYVQAVVMGCLMLYKIIGGYITYYAAKGVFLSVDVLRFFLEWLTVVGFVKWTWSVVVGIEPLTILSIVGIVSTLLTYPLYVLALVRYDSIRLRHLVTIACMFPFWLFLMCVSIICIPELFNREQYNRWKKNE